MARAKVPLRVVGDAVCDAVVVSNSRVIFSARQAAAALWTYGEDGLVPTALEFDERELRSLWSIAGRHWKPDHGLPVTGRLVLDKVTAIACIQFVEGGLRPLAQERRRPAKSMPANLRGAAPVPPETDTR